MVYSSYDLLYIAVCDDDEFTHKEVDEVLRRYEDLKGISIEIVHFYNARDLLDYEGDIHILLLDIAMPDINGIEAGQLLRKSNKHYRIIMLTSTTDMAADCMKIGAFRFVMKPIYDGNDLFCAIDDALMTFIGYEKILVKFNNTGIYLHQYQIDYIKSMGNYIKIYAGNKKYDKYISLKNLMNEIDRRLFVQADKSHVINLSRVIDIKRTSCILINGAEIPISRRNYKAFTEAYCLFDSKGYNGISNGFFY